MVVLPRVTELIEEDLQAVEALLARQADGFHEDIQAALHHLLQAGGKRMRPTVALLAGRMVGAERDTLLHLAAALEMLHTATLVHDDLIDGALLRRGVPTLNAQWSPAATVLTGDFLFARAAHLAAQTRSLAVMERFAETLSIIVDGEIRQMFEGGRYITREAYYRRIYAKTASMFELATVAAGLLGQPSPEEAEALQQYGYAFGMAFQIVDDILDFCGDPKTLGKPVGGDLRNGLVTLPVLLYREHHQDADLEAFLEGRTLSRDALDALIDRIRYSSALALAMEEARSLVQAAVDALSVFPPSPERTALKTLAHYVVEREA